MIETDLRICLVRPLTDIDRRFCFEVISPNKSHVLQADNEDLYQRWMAVLQYQISSAIHETITEENKVEPGDAEIIKWEDSDTDESPTVPRSTKANVRRTAKQILLIPGEEEFNKIIISI